MKWIKEFYYEDIKFRVFLLEKRKEKKHFFISYIQQFENNNYLVILINL